MYSDDSLRMTGWMVYNFSISMTVLRTNINSLRGRIIMSGKRFCIPIISVTVYSIAFMTLSYKPAFANPFNIIIEGPSEAGKVCINIKDAPTEICKFTMDMKSDTKVLKYNSSTRGDLVQSPAFALWDVNPQVPKKPGVVRIGGVDLGSKCILPGSSGTLVCLEYDVLNPKGNREVTVENLTGQLTGMKVKYLGKKNQKEKEPRDKN